MNPLDRPMTDAQRRTLAYAIERIEYLVSLAKISLGTDDTADDRKHPRKVWHAARAARYLRSGVNEATAELAKLRGIMAESARDERKPLTPAQRRKCDAHKRQMAAKYGRAAA